MAVGRSLKILVLSTFDGTNASVIRDFLFSFNRYSRHKYYYVFDCAELDGMTEFDYFDVILVFWSLDLRPPSFLFPEARARIRRAAARKVLFLQDEYREVRFFNHMMSELGVNVMFTCVDESDHALFYPPSLVPTLEATYTVLTGYVPRYLERARPGSRAERPLDIGYRSREVPFWLGDLGREKWIIADRFQAISAARGLCSDISVREEDRLYGDEWVRFLRRSRCVLGSPSGASVVDFSGEIQRNCERYLETKPTAKYDEVRRAFFADVDGKVVIDTVSPRMFEAAALGCTLVQLEGHYAGVVEADHHYIRVKRDYSNLAEVVDRMKDRKFCRRLAEHTYADLVASGQYSYRTFVQEFDGRLSRHAPGPVHSRPLSRPRFYARAYLRHDQRILPFGNRFVVIPAYWRLWLMAGGDIVRRGLQWPGRVASSLVHELARLTKGILAFRIALASPALRGLFVCFWLTRAAQAGVRVDRLLSDLLKLEVVRRARRGLLSSREPFELTVALDDRGVLTLRSVVPGSVASGGVHGLATEVEAALRERRISGVVWDHSALGQCIECQLAGPRWITLALGADGVHRLEAVTRLLRHAPERSLPYLLAILDAGNPGGRHAPARVEQA